MGMSFLLGFMNLCNVSILWSSVKGILSGVVDRSVVGYGMLLVPQRAFGVVLCTLCNVIYVV